MKKTLFILIALSLFAAPVMAADFTCGDGEDCEVSPGTTTDVISVLSTNVEANVTSSANLFSAATAHTSGSKQYATSSETTKIYSAAYGDGTTLQALTNSDTTDFSSWDTL